MKNSKPTWKEILAFAVGDGGCIGWSNNRFLPVW